MRLWLKLACAGLLMLVAVLAVVQVTSSRLLQDTILQQLRARGAELAQPLSAALVAPLLQQDFATVQAVLDDIAAGGHLQALQLVDATGATLARSGTAGVAPQRGLATAYTGANGSLSMDFEVPLQAAGQPLGRLRYALSAQALEDAGASQRRQLLQVSALAVAILGLLLVLLSRRLAAPLQRLGRAAEQMAQGHYDVSLPRAGRDEIGRLAHHVAALRDAIGQRITQLAQAKDEAEAANRAKSMFLANTSHELRTPLNGLLGMAKLARQSGLDEAKRQRYLDLMVEAGNNLADILNDTLDLAKIEAGKLTLEVQAFDPRALLQTTLATYRPLADAAGLGLSLAIDRDVPALVLGDALRVRQILVNYLSNALKFTERGTVRVRLRRVAPERLRLAVSDNGPGIPAELQARLFTPFTQGDASVTRRHGGSGLGLAICRELASRMDGDVGIDDTAEAPGQPGATFWAELHLPEAGAPPTAAAATPAADAQCLRPPDASCIKGMRVLVAEDNPINRVLAMALLETWSMEPAPAYDGEQAVAEVTRAHEQGRPYGAVLMDLQMPVMDGLTATRALRRRWTADELPIIALTASALTHERSEALAAGVTELLTKPIDSVRLRELLILHLGTRPATTT